MSNYIIPTIGSSGYYNLLTPFDTIITGHEKYTCKSIRKISEYLANNEDVKQDVYIANGLVEQDYDNDAKEDMAIVGLQNGTGHWVFVPVRFISTYPITNGIPYRSLMIGCALPAIPAEKDLSHILTGITDVIKDGLGVTPNIRLVETSKVSLIDSDKHSDLTMTRNVVMAGKTTDRSRYMSTLNELNNALAKIAALEQYIKDNHL